MRALLLERAGSCLRPPFERPTFQGPGLSHPVPRRRNPDRWTCARSAACPGMQGLPATTGNSMLLCVVGLFWRLAPALGRLRARAHPQTRLSRRSRSRWAGPAQKRCPSLCLSSLAIVASASPLTANPTASKLPTVEDRRRQGGSRRGRYSSVVQHRLRAHAVDEGGGSGG